MSRAAFAAARRSLLVGLLGLAIGGPWRRGGAEEVPEPTDYRRGEYRAPVPRTLAGATVLDTAGLIELLAREPAVLIDVMPAPRRPPGRGSTRPWLPPARRHIPGSFWLANVGLGDLPPSTAAWLEERLGAITAGRPDRPLVFYCDRDCWMSWNAARRALRELGYRRVFWYPDGIQGWEAAGLPLVPAAPEMEPEP